MADFGIGEGLFALLDAVEGTSAIEGVTVAAPAIAGAAGGVSAGTIAGVAGGAAAGAAGGAALSGGGSSGSSVAATGGSPTTNAAPSGAPKPQPSFFDNLVKYAGPAVAGGVASTGAQALLGSRRGPAIPPPPGSAMIDPAGAQAAAMIRARQAIAGGLGSTISPGAGNQPAYTGATSGGKSLLGQ